jgi:hypothetical protein
VTALYRQFGSECAKIKGEPLNKQNKSCIYYRNSKTHNFIKLVSFLLGVFLPWLITSEAYAQGNMHFGSLKIHPLFSISESYDDNIFDTPDSQVSDLITTYSPGLNLSLPIRGIRSELNINYLTDILEYRDNPDESTVNHHLEGSFKTEFPGGLGITLEDRFEDTEQPQTFDYIYGQLIQRTRRETNYFTTTVALHDYFARFDPALYYSFSDYKYETFEDSNYNEQKIGAQISYKLFTKINALTEFNMGKTDYDTGFLNSNFYEYLLGAQFKETAKTTGNFKVGYRIRDYEDEELDQFNGPVFSLESNTQLTALTSISVLLRRSQEEVIFFTEDVGNFYELNSLYLTLSRKLTSKLEANLSSYYQIQDYPSSSADEAIKDISTWGFRTALKYNIQKWLSADLSYWHEDRSSDFGRKKNVIAFTINAVF